MDRSLRLAALASAAVPGLDPMSVQEVLGTDDESFDVAFVQDTQQRRWVVRAPRTEVAAAHMDASLAMLALLVRRVPFAVPAAKGFAAIPGIGRASVHAYIPGHPLDLAALRAGHPVTAELGRTIAMIHNVDRALYDEAGLASYDAETYRRRHLAEIDRGAATGRVPAGLLGRWEEALDDVRLWRFAPTPVHGALSGSRVLVTFPDPTDASRATIRGVTGWEAAKVADPADDFAALVGQARPDVVDAVLTSYAHVRVERPDEFLVSRARLASELELLSALLRAVGVRDEVATEATTARLRRLDETVNNDSGGRRLRIVPLPTGAAAVAPPAEREVSPSPGPDTSEHRESRSSDGTDTRGRDPESTAELGRLRPRVDAPEAAVAEARAPDAATPDAATPDAAATESDSARVQASVPPAGDTTDVIDTVEPVEPVDPPGDVDREPPEASAAVSDEDAEQSAPAAPGPGVDPTRTGAATGDD